MRNFPIKVYNYYYFLLFSPLLVIVTLSSFKNYGLLFQILTSIILVYFLSCVFIKKITFNEEDMLIFCPTRIFKRKTIIVYDNIIKIKYTNSIYPKEWKVYLVNNKKKWFTTPNGITAYKTDKIFNLFKDRGISIKSNHPKYCTGEYFH